MTDIKVVDDESKALMNAWVSTVIQNINQLAQITVSSEDKISKLEERILKLEEIIIG